MTTIGVFFGSRSPEHDVSIITAQLIISGLKSLSYKVIPIYISKKGGWYIGGNLDSLKTFQDPHFDIETTDFDRYYLDLEESKGKMVFKSKTLLGKKVIIDLAFPSFHGSFGEDGTVQGLFEMFSIPYVGCDVSSSAIAMDKIVNKLLYQALGFPTTKFMHFDKNFWEKDRKAIITSIKKSLKLPFFVKPPNLGSSIGITKIQHIQDLEDAIDVAVQYGDSVLVEEGVENLVDLTCCVIGNDDPIPSLLQESVFSSDLFNFDEKYLKKGGAHLGKAQDSIIIPARLDDKTTQAIQIMSVAIYKTLGLSGIGRIDFLYNQKTKKIYANEINPLPGTLYYHLWNKSGIQLPALLEKLIGFAKERHDKHQKIAYSFSSSILSQSGSPKLPNP